LGWPGLAPRAADDGKVDFLQRFGTDALAEVHHHQGIEEVLAEVFVQAEEVLEKRVLTDLSDGTTTAHPKSKTRSDTLSAITSCVSPEKRAMRLKHRDAHPRYAKTFPTAPTYARLLISHSNPHDLRGG